MVNNNFPKEARLVPKLLLGNPYIASSCLAVLREARASKTPFPSRSSRRYTQVLEARHFGRDAEIQRPRMANCGTQQMPLYPRTGNYGLASHLNQALA